MGGTDIDSSVCGKNHMIAAGKKAALSRKTGIYGDGVLAGYAIVKPALSIWRDTRVRAVTQATS
jgi:hypothetical protein